MTKKEFLAKLKEALENDLDSYRVQENLAYYQSYIDEEMRKGRREEVVLEELGDPWVIAQSVIEMSERSGKTEEYFEGQSVSGYERDGWGARHTDAKVHTFTVDSWFKRLLVILGVLGIIMVVFAVIGGLISLILPVLLPILLVLTLIRILRR